MLKTPRIADCHTAHSFLARSRPAEDQAKKLAGIAGATHHTSTMRFERTRTEPMRSVSQSSMFSSLDSENGESESGSAASGSRSASRYGDQSPGALDSIDRAIQKHTLSTPAAVQLKPAPGGRAARARSQTVSALPVEGDESSPSDEKPTLHGAMLDPLTAQMVTTGVLKGEVAKLSMPDAHGATAVKKLGRRSDSMNSNSMLETHQEGGSQESIEYEMEILGEPEPEPDVSIPGEVQPGVVGP